MSHPSSRLRRFLTSRTVRWTAAILALAFLAIQFVPYGREHGNPPVTGQPKWDSPRTEQLARRACFDCHSNETEWPWYASIAPLSWRIQNHVDEGRRHLNFSEFDRPQDDADEAADMVRAGEMPPWDYALAHPEARLTAAEQRDLIVGLERTFGGKKEKKDDEEDEDEHENHERHGKGHER